MSEEFNLRYCKKCLLPNSRPGVVIDENGISNVWKTAKLEKEKIDWKQREASFRKLADNVKSKNAGYDCLIPVSGGKDSTWQVMKCLEYGLNPLAVTWKTPARTELGQHNLDCLIALGVDHIDYQVSPAVEKKFMYKSLVKYGTTALPMHMALFNIPLTIAVKFKIPLVIWGENSAFEYGSTDDELMGFELNSKWLKKYGVTHGTTADDWVSDELTEKELTPYYGPTDENLRESGTRAIFLGHYFSWDTETSLNAAVKGGFKVREEGPKTGYYNYADIDDDFISIHHFIKWYKFGFTRLFDNLSIEIRNGRMDYDQAVEIIKEYGIQEPKEDIAKVCDYMDISQEHFYEILETFRNHDIWSKEDGKWVIKDFLIKNWNW